MKWGYARVSSGSQSLDIQIDELTRAGCEMIRQEKVSGRSTENRPELQLLLDFIRPGDELVVVRLDRLARSTLDLCKIVKTLEDKGASLRATRQTIETASPTGRLLVQILAVLAEFENEIRRERQMAGIAAAKEKGVYVSRGRTATIKPDDIHKLLDSGLSPTAVARALNIGRASVYRLKGS